MPAILPLADVQTNYPDIIAGIEPRTLSNFILVHEEPFECHGDYSIDPTRSDPNTPRCHIFLSDLTIHGSLLNLSMEGGKTLIVGGMTRADNIIAGGSFIYLREAIVPGIVFGHYNDGMIKIEKLKGDLVVSDDHDMQTRFETIGVSIHDNPNGGFDLIVDDIRPDLDFSDHYDLQAHALVDYFADGTWLDLWIDGDDPQEIKEAIQDFQFSVKWMEWVEHKLEKGRQGSVAEFQRFTQHFRDAYAKVPCKPVRS